MGHRLMLMKEPNGQCFRRWQHEIPNHGLLRYLDIFNTETVVPVSSKALAEVLVQKAYDFTKPPQLIAGLGNIFGVGVFLAEGEEHKVSSSFGDMTCPGQIHNVELRNNERISTPPSLSDMSKNCILSFGRSQANCSMP